MELRLKTNLWNKTLRKHEAQTNFQKHLDKLAEHCGLFGAEYRIQNSTSSSTNKCGFNLTCLRLQVDSTWKYNKTKLFKSKSLFALESYLQHRVPHWTVFRHLRFICGLFKLGSVVVGIGHNHPQQRATVALRVASVHSLDGEVIGIL